MEGITHTHTHIYNIYIYIYSYFESLSVASNIFNGRCGDEDPNLYTGPWALFDNVDASEEK